MRGPCGFGAQRASVRIAVWIAQRSIAPIIPSRSATGMKTPGWISSPRESRSRASSSKWLILLVPSSRIGWKWGVRPPFSIPFRILSFQSSPRRARLGPGSTESTQRSPP